MTEQDDITDMKKCRTGRRWMAGLLLGLGILLAGCGDRQSTAEDIATPEDTQTDRIVVGFSQVGAESDWRSANTESMKSTFTKEAGYDLIFEDGQQKQANQIRAIRTFIQQEVDYIVLAPVTETAHVLDTTRLLPSQLRRWVQQFVKQSAAKLTLTFESFGYKRGLPYASDLVFDVRCLPNPYYSPELRPLTGLDAPVASYLAQEPLVSEMIDDIAAFIAKWLPHYRGQNRHYLTICIGCTGGQHRSVYVAEMLGRRFADQAGTIVRHRALSANLLPENKLQTL